MTLDKWAIVDEKIKSLVSSETRMFYLGTYRVNIAWFLSYSIKGILKALSHIKVNRS